MLFNKITRRWRGAHGCSPAPTHRSQGGHVGPPLHPYPYLFGKLHETLPYQNRPILASMQLPYFSNGFQGSTSK